MEKDLIKENNRLLKENNKILKAIYYYLLEQSKHDDKEDFI